MPQAEVQADPQEVLYPEDPEEGGINSPFFLKNHPKPSLFSLIFTNNPFAP